MVQVAASQAPRRGVTFRPRRLTCFSRNAGHRRLNCPDSRGRQNQPRGGIGDPGARMVYMVQTPQQPPEK